MHPITFSPSIENRVRDSRLRFAVTGASGWLGQATLEMLERALGDAFSGRVFAFGSHARDIATRSGRTVAVLPLPALASLPPAPTVLLHYAFLTKERTDEMSSSDYFSLSEGMTDVIGSAIPRIGVERMLFISSGAVYGLPTRPDRSTKDDPKANPYGTQKLRDEQQFARTCEKHGVRLAIPRIFNLSGPFINKHNSYALSSIINAALSGLPVELRARRPVMRGYVAVRDVLDVVFGWILSGSMPDQLAVDTGGEIVEVGELALRVLKVLNISGLTVKRPPLESGPEDRYLGDGKAFESLAKDQGIHLLPLDGQIADTAAYLSSLRA